MLTLTPLSLSHVSVIQAWFRSDSAGMLSLSQYQDVGKWSQLLDPSARWAWMVMNDAQPIGFADLEKGGEQGYLALYIAPPYRKQGFGKKTLDLLLDECAKNHMSTLTGTADEQNSAGQSTLLSAGFVQTGKNPEGYLLFSKVVPQR